MPDHDGRGYRWVRHRGPVSPMNEGDDVPLSTIPGVDHEPGRERPGLKVVTTDSRPGVPSIPTT